MIEADYNQVLKDLLKERETAYIRKYCPVFEPEAAHYTVKTTAPYLCTTWKLNFLRRHRDQELRDESMKAARMKCHLSANSFQKCSLDHPGQEPQFCKSIYTDMKRCFAEETEVEHDKRRRDIQRNHEWWWTNIYDEEGNIGVQTSPPPDTYVEKTLTFCYAVLDALDGWMFRHDK